MKKMKKFVLLALALIFCLNINAQLDRSVMPIGGPSPKIKLDKPKEFKLKNGIRVLVVENHKLPRINYSLRFDRKPIVEGEKAGVISLLGSMLGNGTTTISKDDFNVMIEALVDSTFCDRSSNRFTMLWVSIENQMTDTKSRKPEVIQIYFILNSFVNF